MDSRLEHVLELNEGSFQFSSTLFRFSKGDAAGLEIPVRNILWVEKGKDGAVQVSALVKKGKKHSLSRLDGVAMKLEAVAEWAATLLNTAYDGVKPSRRLRVLVNPVGGPGRAVRTYEQIVLPIFEAAHCLLDTTYTDHRGHMTSIVKDLDFKYDAIVVLSGDGGVHEVINGLAQRPDGRKALTIPVTQIPTGSANALCVNVLGPKDPFDVHISCLNVIKGKPMQIDVCSVSQGNKRVFSTLSQALGLMADLDLGTEHLRWMGDARFMYGFLRGVIASDSAPIKVELKIADDDKHHLVKVSKNNAGVSHYVEPVDHDNWGDHEHDLPPLLHTGPAHRDETEGWTKYDGDILYLYAGSMPYVARDLMQFPVVEPADGTLDIVVQNVAARKTMLEAIFMAPKGHQYWIPSQNYYRVKAYRVKMLAVNGNFSADGEAYPFESYEVEAHPGLARTLSLTGRFVIDDTFHSSRPSI